MIWSVLQILMVNQYKKDKDSYTIGPMLDLSSNDETKIILYCVEDCFCVVHYTLK